MRTTIDGRHLAALVGLIVALLPAATAIGAPSPAATTWTGRVEATVLDATTGAPVAGAHVSGPGDLAGLTDAGGLRAATLSLPAPETPLTVTISAPGYGDWLLSNVRVLADDTLYLTARLGPEPIIQEAPQPTTVREPLSRAELEALLDLPPNYVDQTQWGVP
ncbi:MAG TPA: carboxypeptidase-like regulatory domain-containing protein, partial [Anaerolineales bacterium]|nr:carboxypeptidase-like regulatory domain-containing protein [Anaerolineales bacterium]